MMKRKETFKKIGIYLILPVVLGLLFSHFILQFSNVCGDSMYPTYDNGDYVLVKKFHNQYEKGDIVIVKEEGRELIKRIAGTPGDAITFQKKQLYVNGKVAKFYNYQGIEPKNFQSIVLKKEEYLVIGDNFEVSYDGRSFGAVSKSCVIGKVVQF